MHYAANDNLCALGTLIIERVAGWPMGGSFSEPATLVDLGEDIFSLYDEDQDANISGWRITGFSLDELVQALQHVDDAFLLSLVWCTDCLYKGVLMVWPQDVGVKLEEFGPMVRFLQSTVHVVNSRFLEVLSHPFVTLFAFLLTFCPSPTLSYFSPK